MNSSSRRSEGFVLLTVVVLLAILASLVMMVASTTDTDVAIDGQLAERAALNYAAESGLEHAIWTLNQLDGCSNYADLPTTPLGDVSYRASIFPQNGSPVSITSEGFLANGGRREIIREGVLVYDRSDLRTLTLGGEAQIKDVFIEGENGHTDHNKATDHKLTVSGEPGKAKRVLLEFDLSELPGNVRVESAVLELELNKFDSIAEIEIYRITQDWTEAGVSWETRDGSNEWVSAGGDYADRLVGLLSIDSVGPTQTELTDLVASWGDGTFENYGLMLLLPESSGLKSNEFISSDDNTGPFPTLTITYSCECGAVCVGAGGALRPLAHWRLDDGVDFQAIDSESGHNGTLENGAHWSAAGQLNGALEFDGLNDQIVVPHDAALSLTGALTITAWIKSDEEPTGFANRILSKETPGFNDNFWLSTQGGALWFGVGGAFFTEGQLLNNDQWYHVAATYDSVVGEVRMYIDGVEGSAESTTTTITANAEQLIIGSNWEQTKYWHGYLDDVRLYDRALTQEEILEVVTDAPVGGGVSVTGSYRDRFNARSYTGNDGSLNWSSDWLEIGESDGSNRGDERTVSDNFNEYAIRVRDNDNGGEGVQREFDLSGCAGSVFSFDYRREGFDNVNDFVTASVSSNGGSSWTDLTRFSGPADDAFYLHYVTDISAHAASNSRIRFLSSPAFGGADILWVDNVDITCK